MWHWGGHSTAPPTRHKLKLSMVKNLTVLVHLLEQMWFQTGGLPSSECCLRLRSISPSAYQQMQLPQNAIGQPFHQPLHVSELYLLALGCANHLPGFYPPLETNCLPEERLGWHSAVWKVTATTTTSAVVTQVSFTPAAPHLCIPDPKTSKEPWTPSTFQD